MSLRPGGVRGTDAVRRLYDRLAPIYDLASRPYGWFGTRRLAARAIGELWLQPGDTVVELGTGTGRNLPDLARAVGPSGRVVGVDLSRGMLRRARSRVAAAGLTNVDLVEADMTNFRLPPDTAAALSTYAMEMVPTYDALIARLSHELRPGGRLVLNGLREPVRWPRWLIAVASALSRPFGVTRAYRELRPWTAAGVHLDDVIHDEALAGAAYLAAGTAPGGSRGERVDGGGR